MAVTLQTVPSTRTAPRTATNWEEHFLLNHQKTNFISHTPSRATVAGWVSRRRAGRRRRRRWPKSVAGGQWSFFKKWFFFKFGKTQGASNTSLAVTYSAPAQRLKQPQQASSLMHILESSLPNTILRKIKSETAKNAVGRGDLRPSCNNTATASRLLEILITHGTLSRAGWREIRWQQQYHGTHSSALSLARGMCRTKTAGKNYKKEILNKKISGLWDENVHRPLEKDIFC